MDLLSGGINAAVVATVGLLLARLAKGQFEALDRRFQSIDQRFESIDRRFEGNDRQHQAIEERIETRMEAFQRSLDAMRSDLTQVALAVGVRPQAADH